MAYHHEWSQSYMRDYRLTFEEHHLNNEWFNSMLAMLKPEGELHVPLINKTFDKEGKEITDHYNTGVELDDVTDEWYDTNGDIKQ